MALAASNFSPAFRAAKLAEFGLATPLVAVTVADVAGSMVAGGTGADAGCWDTAPNRDNSINAMAEMKTVANDLLAAAAAMGIPITVT